MFGKGGGPLNAWIKEFCELVFIQTLQAFIFALVMGFVLSILTEQSIMGPTDSNTSLGIICIVALTSIFKVEDIARRIFGYGPTKADHGNAVQSIGKSMMAMRLGKNLLDNGKKVVGGAGAFVGSHGQKLKALKRKQRRLDALDKDNNGDYDDAVPKNKLPVKGDKNISNDDGNENKDAVAEKQRLLQLARKQKNAALKKRIRAQEIREGKNTKNLSSKEKKHLPHELELKAAEAEAEAFILEDKANAIDIKGDVDVDESNKRSVSSSSKNGSGRIKDYNQKKMQIEEDFDSRMSEINKQKRQGLKQMVSGVAETGAALVGFTAGTGMSVTSTNDWGSAMKDGIAWAGTADAVTAGAVDLGFGIEEFAENRLENAGKLLGEYGENVKSAYKNYVSEMESIDEQIAKDTQQQADDLKKSIEKEASRATNVASTSKVHSSSQTKREVIPSKKGAAVRSMGKGLKTTLLNHSVVAQKKIIDETIVRLDKMNAPAKPLDVDKNILN